MTSIVHDKRDFYWKGQTNDMHCKERTYADLPLKCMYQVSIWRKQTIIKINLKLKMNVNPVLLFLPKRGASTNF